MRKLNLEKIKMVIIVIVPIAIFIFLFSKIDVLEFLIVLKKINIIFLLTGAFIFLFSDFFINPLQWLRALLSLGYSFNLKEAITIKIANFPIKAILPLKTGDLIRAVYLQRRKGIPLSAGVSSLGFNLILNLLVLVIIMCLGYILFNAGLFYGILFCSGVLLLFILTSLFFRFIKKVILYLAGIVNSRLHNSVESLFDIYNRFNFKDFSALLFYSVLIWASELLTFFVLFKAVGLNIPFHAIVVFVPLVILISNLPITISGLGTREAVILFCFSKFGSPENLLSAGILISFLYFALPLTLSLFFIRKFLKQITLRKIFTPT